MFRPLSFSPSIRFNHIMGCAQSKVSCLLAVGAAIIPPASFKTTNKRKMQAVRCTHANTRARIFPFMYTLEHILFSRKQGCFPKQLREEFCNYMLWCCCNLVASHSCCNMCRSRSAAEKALCFFGSAYSLMLLVSYTNPVSANSLCALRAVVLVLSFFLSCI